MQIARQNTTMMEAFSILAVSIFPTLLGFAFFAFALRDFTVLGTALFAVLVALIVSGIVLAFFPVPIAHLIWSIIGAIVFSLYIAYDVSIAVNKGIENPVHVALSLYLDVMNLFLSLLNISSFDLD